MQYVLGGNRVGSGKKMRGNLTNYNRSTHNLSERFISSMASGVLYPAMCKIAMRGDSFDIGISADARTIPTLGPLFGRFKLQVDVYQVPIRLYQGILHNNPLAIGLQMDKVYFPELHILGSYNKNKERGVEFSKSSLLKYLGMSGLGRRSNPDADAEQTIYRNINAIPALAYYDIFKNYYANKQEENAYVLTSDAHEDYYGEITKINGVEFLGTEQFPIKQEISGQTTDSRYIVIEGKELNPENVTLFWTNLTSTESGNSTLYELNEENQALYSVNKERTKIEAVIQIGTITKDTTIETTQNVEYYFKNQENVIVGQTHSLAIQEFPLSNIDDMRYELLCFNQLGERFVIGGPQQSGGHEAYLPYSTLTDRYIDEETYYRTLNQLPMNGLVLKTYLNDIYNNWLNTEWIEGENGITELTKVSVTNGAFSMDALNFAQKLYNMLNRIAVAGATYEDWQDAVYEQVKRRQIESPIFCGGLSQDVIFDEVVQTAPSDTDDSVLGTLGGRGRLDDKNRKGGNIHIKCDEACFIIAIASLTPRQVYTQANEFYMTDLKSINDLHKPAMDGIGFQDLIGERLAWWDTTIPMTNGQAGIPQRSKIGKLPAWIEYMTSVDKAYGDFAEEYGKGYMVLNRNYEVDTETGGIKDATTYIDPSKYNYAFAYDALDAQNFWVEIHFNIKARRLMSARLIPNV